MRAAASLALVALTLTPGALLPAQGGWTPPQPPCEVPPANSKIGNAIAALKTAVEKPESRDQQLAQAQRLLAEAINQDKQSANPAAWYYLGRLAVTTGDVAGADTAFARALTLAPKCAEDIAGYRHELWGELLNNGLAAWQDGKQDSGLALLRAAVRLEPANPKPLVAAAGLFASRGGGGGGDDSAFAYYRLAAKTAGTDTAFAQDKRDALANAWHLVVRKVQGHPAAQRVLKLRAGLDSMQRGIASDSSVLARLLASSQSRKARGTRLAPADQQLFTRDSAARAQALAQRRARLTAALEQIAADSSALAGAFAPAIDALSEYVAAYPGEPESAMALATLYAQSGRWALAAAVFDSLAGHAPDLEPEALFGPGARLVEQGMYRAGARALTLGLGKNPYRRDALFSLAVAYYQLHDSTSLLPVAQRLLALDPLNRASLKLVAAGWDFRRGRDSTKAYVARADSALAVEISVPSFVPDTTGASLEAGALNLKSTPSTPLRLTVEFLDPSGQVVATASQDVPSLAPRQNRLFELHVSGKRIAA